MILILRMTCKQLPGLTELARTSKRFKHQHFSTSLLLGSCGLGRKAKTMVLVTVPDQRARPLGVSPALLLTPAVAPGRAHSHSQLAL